MDSLNNSMQEYKKQLSKGEIQKAYKGIMTFMSGLSKYLEDRYPDYTTSALYHGYMDMTYFAFTPLALKNKKLKVAIVYLHEAGRFEAWLGGMNRKIQADYIQWMRRKYVGNDKLSQVLPGVDSIIESILVEKPDFDHPEELKKQIETRTMEFVKEMLSIMDERH